jgi:hypothetical protein
VRSTARAALLLFLIASASQAAPPGWRDRATPPDLHRLDQLAQAWREGLGQARSNHTAEVRALGPLAEPQRALARPLPPPGAYRCRTIKLGSQGDLGLNLVAYGWFRCRIERSPRGELTFIKATGSQRALGVLYPDGDRRLVYLGAAAFGDEGWMAYGARADRDQAGVLERVEAGRWRLSLPLPAYESKIDLIELKR